MRYGSVCSGIEAASCAWEGLGWQPQWFAEIEPFPSAVLAHHYPTVPNLGDFTKIGVEHGPIELLVGGTPCQAFSVAGGRAGLDDPRGNLTLEYLALAGRLRPRWLLWENVPGVLSIDGGRTFGTILGTLAQLGYGFAYRVLDAQYFGVPQRRRRVFVVGYLGDWRPAAAVLFERHSLQRHPTPRREKRERVADSLTVGANQYSGFNGFPVEASTFATGSTNEQVAVSPTLASRVGDGPRRNQGGVIVGANNHGMRDVSTSLSGSNQRLDGDTETFVLQHAQIGRKLEAGPQGKGWQEGVAFTLDSRSQSDAIAFDTAQITSKTNRTRVGPEFPASTLNSAGQMHVADVTGFTNRAHVTDSLVETIRAGSHGALPMVQQPMTVRRLTPRECERLQGFPDGWTAVPFRGKPAADGPRYRAIGNSMAVPVMRWLGERIQAVDDILSSIQREEAAA